MTEEKQTQIEKFKEAARALGCDEHEDHFKANLRDVVKAPKRPEGDTKPDRS